MNARALMLRSFLAGLGFSAALAVSAAGVAVALKFAGYDAGYVVSRVGEGLFARATVGALEARVEKLETAALAAAAPDPAPSPAGRRGGDAGFASLAGMPLLALAQELPPMRAAETPGLAGVPDASEVDFSPTIPVPDFDRGRTLRVCAGGGCDYSQLNAAIDAARDGDVISLRPGLYPECLRNLKKNIAIVGEIGEDGSRPTFNTACLGKAAFNVASAYFRVEGLQFQDISVRDNNGACLRLQPPREASQVAHVKNVVCVRSENGILGNVGPEGALIIESSLFAENGRGGRAHGLYVGSGRELVLRNSIIHSSKEGAHSVKTGVERLLVYSSIIAALDGRNSRAIDFFGGGVLYVEDSVLQQGPNSDNHDMIGLAHESRRLNLGVPHAVYVRDSWLIYDDPNRCCRWLLSGRKTGDIVFENNRLVAMTGSKLEGYTERASQRLQSRDAAGLEPYTGSLASLPRPSGWK